MALGVGREAAAVLAAQAGRADLLARVGFTLIMSLATTFWVLLFRRVLAQRKAAEYQAGEQRRADWASARPRRGMAASGGRRRRPGRREAVGAIVLTVRDMRERAAFEQRLAFHDPLTGLANRALFADRLEPLLARHLHAGLQLAG